MAELKFDVDRFRSQEELKAYMDFLETIDDDYFKQFKSAEEMNSHINYLNSQQFLDDLMKKRNS